jgi:hypothetical protein
LQRDGLVDEIDRRADGSVVYAITDAGRTDVAAWWERPVERGEPARDELAIKLALAVTTKGVDVASVAQRQRTETLRSLQSFTRAKSRATDPDSLADLSWLLVLDHLVFAAEAEVRWLDHVETMLARRTARPASGTTPITTATRHPPAVVSSANPGGDHL